MSLRLPRLDGSLDCPTTAEGFVTLLNDPESRDPAGNGFDLLDSAGNRVAVIFPAAVCARLFPEPKQKEWPLPEIQAWAQSLQLDFQWIEQAVCHKTIQTGLPDNKIWYLTAIGGSESSFVALVVHPEDYRCLRQRI